MNALAFHGSMLATHLPYLAVALFVVLFVRRMRRAVERLADDLEARAERR